MKAKSITMEDVNGQLTWVSLDHIQYVRRSESHKNITLVGLSGIEIRLRDEGGVKLRVLCDEILKTYEETGMVPRRRI